MTPKAPQPAPKGEKPTPTPAPSEMTPAEVKADKVEHLLKIQRKAWERINRRRCPCQGEGSEG